MAGKRRGCLLCGFSVLAAVLVGAQIALYFAPGRVFLRSYARLAIGQSKQEVVDIFGRTPDYCCSYGESEIDYFFREAYNVFRVDYEPQTKEVGGERVPIPPDEMPSAVARKEEIPYAYGACLTVFDRDGVMRAFTWNGEETHVHTDQGDVEGDHLSILGEALFR